MRQVGSKTKQSGTHDRNNKAKGQIHLQRISVEDEVAERPTDMGKNKHATNTTAKKRKISKKERMLANPEIKRWYDNLARGSPITAETRIRRLSKFCEIHEMTAMDLANLGMKDLRTVTNLLEDHITMMEEKKYSPGYIGDFITAVKSWLVHFDVQIKRKLKVTNPNATPTLRNERVPDAQEISEVFARASLRSSVMISLIGKSGLRPEVLGNHDGSDGLSIKDLPDIVIHQGIAKCIRVTNQIVVRENLSKTKHQYFTFLTTSGTSKLIAYLNDRLAAGEPLHGDSPVIAPDYKYKTYRGKNANKSFLPTRQICKEIRKTFRPRFKWRPYILRAYFDTELLIAESKGKIAHDFRVFFMGHKGTMESKYTTNKGILPEILVKEMREAFKRSEEFLDLEVKTTNPILEQKQDMHETIQNATPDELGQMLEMCQKLNIGNISQASRQ